MTFWQQKWWNQGRTLSTSDAVERELIHTENGGSDAASDIARATASAFGKLIACLEDNGVLSPAEITKIADLYGYEQVDA